MISKTQAISAVIFALLFSAISVFAQTKTSETSEKFPPVEIKGSHIRRLKSVDTKRDYDLYIKAPKLVAGKKYPVLFVLDGQWDFKLLDSVYGGLYYDRYVPEMIIVGITYTGENPDYDALRAMDYTPTREERLKNSGDAAKFLQFLKKDLIPFVEKNYQADASKRILMGSSLGGLFTLYALFTEPDLFAGYVAASPAVSYGNNFSFKQEKQFAQTRRDLPVKLYIGVGDSEDLTAPVKEFMQTVKSRAYANLKFETRILEDERHAGNKPEIYNRGLRFVFAEPKN